MRDARRFAATADGGLTATMRAAWAEDGFLALEGFAGREETARLRDRVGALIEGFDPGENRTAFAPGDQSHARAAYFRDSGDKIRFFLEEGAIDASGALTVPKTRAINKIGHALHDLDPVFGAFSRSPRLAALAAELGLADPGLIQSMVICKQPQIGGEVGLHQDATFLHTEPVSVIGFWLALEDADRANGCLTGLPGRHRDGLRQRFRYDGDELVMQTLDHRPWDMAGEAAFEAPEGTLVLLHGLAPHRSAPNLSGRSRLAYALHVIDRAARWSADNWLRRGPELPVRGFA